jgi:serine/threonine protein kinase/DNA polymerase III delta prime subunit
LESNTLLPKVKTLLLELTEGRGTGNQWQMLAGMDDMFRSALQEAVDAASDPAAPAGMFCKLYWLQLNGPGFKDALRAYYRQREVEVEVNRLVNNSFALVATAGVAIEARKLSRSLAGASAEQLALWSERAAGLLRTEAARSTNGRDNVRPHEANTSAGIVDRAFADLAARGRGSAAARYWTLFWLRQHTDLEHYKREVPLVAARRRGDQATLTRLDLWQVEGGTEAELIEHPKTALLPLDKVLLDGVNRAWKSAGPQTVCWNLNAQPVAQNGDSLSGAAAVGFQALSEQEPFLATCLVVARLGDDGKTLHPVSFEREKLEAAYREGVRHAIVAKRGAPGGARDWDFNDLQLKVTAVASVKEARAHTAGDFGRNRYLDRYQTINEIPGSDPRCQVWLGVEDKSTYLIKIWHFDDPRLKDFIRAWWDNELRTMYRLCSSPGADRSLLVIHDAGLDRDKQAYVMVLEGRGYETLASSLDKRMQYPWLRRSNFHNKDARQAIWAGLRRVASGVRLLHSQHVIHGKLSAENVYHNPDLGPETWRLGGFEWSMRIGGLPQTKPSDEDAEGNWHLSPESNREGGGSYTFDTDWYAFGMLAARCFYSVESLKHEPPRDLNLRVLDYTYDDPANLTDFERVFIQQLIATLPGGRPYNDDNILTTIDDIIRRLETGAFSDTDARPLVVTFEHRGSRGQEIYEAARKAGLNLDPKDPTVNYSSHNPAHVTALEEFLSDNFAGALLYPMPYQENSFQLVGRDFSFVISNYKGGRLGQTTLSWNIAEAVTIRELRGARGRGQSLEGVTVRCVNLSRVDAQLNYQSWNRYLPRLESESELGLDLEKFREFLRCTNQIELLFRYAEIFRYRCVEGPYRSGIFERVVVEEDEGDFHFPGYCRVEGGMVEHLQRERESRRANSRVLLTSESALGLPPKVSEPWVISPVQTRHGGRKCLELERRDTGANDCPPVGYLRSFGFHGQIMVVERRKRAIDRMQDHSYLLRALAGSVFIDTKQEKLPYELNDKKVDTSKMAVIKDILRVRPIYALQGPPGTGKTTLVAHLLREILTEDPVAQILVTAQAHGAVDVLRDKVAEEAYGDVEEEKQPLAIRLGRREEDEEIGLVEGTVEQVAEELLERISARMEVAPVDSPIRAEWQALVRRMLLAARSHQTERSLADFQQLVKRGANIIYCTTSARDLEILTDDNQTFDWTVVEEAGKVHGCDLALPMQAGHRWLLLGDQMQLEPYRYDDFKKAINALALDEPVEILRRLSGHDRRFVDSEWLHTWRDRSKEEKTIFIEYALRWLNSFEQLYDTLKTKVHGGTSKVTRERSIGAAAGSLSKQYRMHPAIGQLISHTFYRDGVEDGDSIKDATGRPLPSVCHPFTFDGSPTPDIRGKAIVWIDVPKKSQYRERGPDEGRARYTNPHEAWSVRRFIEDLRCVAPPGDDLDLAVLSPYTQQVRLLEQELQDVTLPPGLRYRESLGDSRQRTRRTHTVDSFQGNQADVVIVSLVRNNTALPTRGLGFLNHHKRLNVLLSRAERLLVLVGSWEFFNYQLTGVTERSTETDLVYWRMLLDGLTAAFEAGQTAVRLPPYPLKAETRRARGR